MTGNQEAAVTEMRVIITSSDFERDLPLYRDVLGLARLEDYSTETSRAVLLSAGRATIELADESHAIAVDDLEVGRRVAGAIRIAFEVVDASQSTVASVEAGATLIAAPMATPWNSINSRLETPGGQQLTLYNV